MNWPIESALKALQEYNKATATMDLAECADQLASCLEAFMRTAAQRDPLLADEVDAYFNAKEDVS